MTTQATTNRFSPEVRKRAVRMVSKKRHGTPSGLPAAPASSRSMRNGMDVRRMPVAWKMALILLGLCGHPEANFELEVFDG